MATVATCTTTSLFLEHFTMKVADIYIYIDLEKKNVHKILFLSGFKLIEPNKTHPN